MMDEFIRRPLPRPSLVHNLWWTIVMDDWNLDEKTHLVSDKVIATLQIYDIPQNIYKEWQIMLGFTLSVGDDPHYTTVYN